MYPAPFGKLPDLKRVVAKVAVSNQIGAIKALTPRRYLGYIWHNLFENGFLSLGQSVVHNGLTVCCIRAFCFYLYSLLHASASCPASLSARSTMWVLLFFCVQPVNVVFGGLAGSKSNPATQERGTFEFAVGVIFVYNAFPLTCQDLGLCKAIQIMPLSWSVSLELVSWPRWEYISSSSLHAAFQNSVVCIPGTSAIH